MRDMCQRSLWDRLLVREIIVLYDQIYPITQLIKCGCPRNRIRISADSYRDSSTC